LIYIKEFFTKSSYYIIKNENITQWYRTHRQSSFKNSIREQIAKYCSYQCNKGKKMLKLLIWYDNEWGYASKVVDIVLASYYPLEE
jgi:glyceraldehyde-3-phosphate dehydrogenase/erythrose-4-phosphate dehydrogenase